MPTEFNICPYTGLRPFTEEESIYFKGRDEHIESATRQLSEKKFIMVTGASGDGKSSLVYAGIIPNARAGFLKATFSNWVVVDFRPERNPLGNLSRALATQLSVREDTVRTELSYGFSSLIDIYKASPWYWQSGDDAERKRKAANVVILADQFEEFFTNPENFRNGAPLPDAATVVGLLLETARIAFQENLPVYVVITMRSDFIGQCAAFRGLPEYIGFSQFFLPRLSRKELQEVIEEPALLSGNRISRRLTERLIGDMAEGLDQLPILQHALNQVWKCADNGSAEMDLIHYAMAGGIRGTELPADQIKTFDNWFSTLPKKIQDCYQHPGLQNVLNTHADKLYSQAGDYFNENSRGKIITDGEAKNIITVAFKCLTKIDDGRPVRNRVSLAEITAIIDNPHWNIDTIGKVLTIFREPGNTLVRPFKDDEPVLSPDAVLDITHESLIRNWESLNVWAKEEYESYLISLDFGKQMNRWVHSGKSDNYLLSVGTLAYFETWINKYKPNAAWLSRYLHSDSDFAGRLKEAESILSNANEFVKKSQRKHRITRTMMRYNSRQVVGLLALLTLFIFGSFVVVNNYKKQNSQVQNKLTDEALRLSRHDELSLNVRTKLACEGIMYQYFTIDDIMDTSLSVIERADLANGIASALLIPGQGDPEREVTKALEVADSLLSSEKMEGKIGADVGKVIKELNDLMENLEMAYFYRPSETVAGLRNKNAERCAAWTFYTIQNQPAGYNNIEALNASLEHALNYKALSEDEIKKLTMVLSPFEGKSSSWVATNYEKDKINDRGFFGYGFQFNGLYQELAGLYAAVGNTDRVLQCVDSLLSYNRYYYENNYEMNADNAFHIASVFYRYNQNNSLDEFVTKYCERRKMTVDEFYGRLVARCKTYEFASTVLNYYPQYDLNVNLALEYSDNAQINFFFSKYRKSLERISSRDERNFLLALSYKDEGILVGRKLDVSLRDSATAKAAYRKLFDRAFELYRSVSPAFLEEEIEVVELSVNDEIKMARKFLFLYPDIRTPFHPNEPRLYHYFYTTAVFLNYMLEKGFVQEFYTDEKSLRFVEIFIRDYSNVERNFGYTLSRQIPYRDLVAFEKIISAIPSAASANLGLLYLYLGNAAAAQNDKENALYYYSQLSTARVQLLFINAFNKHTYFLLVGTAVGNLFRFEQKALADRIISSFSLSINRSSLYAYAATVLLQDGVQGSRVDVLLDSARQIMNQLGATNAIQPNRNTLALAYVLKNDAKGLNEAHDVIRNIELKWLGLALIARGVAYNGQLYEAYGQMPEITSEGGKTQFIRDIWYGYHLRRDVKSFDASWRNFKQGNNFEFQYPLIYAD